MFPHALSMASVLPSIHSPELPFYPSKSIAFHPPKSCLPLRCSVSVAPQPTHLHPNNTNNKTSPAEVSRTIMELSSVGSFSTATQDTWPLGVGVRFAVDSQGTPIVCLSASYQHFASQKSSSLNVQLEQCGMRTTQCTIQGSLHRPDDQTALKKLESLWEKRFGEKADNNFINILEVERVLQMDNFMEDGVWVTSSDYRLANADPLRDFAEYLVREINTNNMEDVLRFCNIYVDSDVQVSEAKMVWVDRLGFDIHIYSPQNDVFEVRIPFPREVADEKGAKSSFNGMSQLAWEVERNYSGLEFEKVKQLKKIASKV
ncbi:glutamyl-tRNA reductase-binding protein, chloroplastic isoform X2 [Cynara cardunculus var. scolymus]|uniref:FMN-binding split barrel n=1 Tax=Cynara cardunculus var. scolymus TaxID=59895 RepID=A0A103YB43_CYNCS|nr:glutamyl-tRNA reductase-binding protein, chloroplastic isoform X2 [Cynara cardunculus var. scolymus]KVI05817.1 FMN-binding split barrel [Cynara cardunculus var. scolymus]